MKPRSFRTTLTPTSPTFAPTLLRLFVNPVLDSIYKLILVCGTTPLCLPAPVPSNSPLIPHEDQAEPSEDLTPNLAEAIVLMTSELRLRSNNSSLKVKEPDTFDGSDPRKLNNFILLCNLYFRNNPTRYEDAAKITFALSYLRGLALEFFEPTLLDSDKVLEWLESWPVFTDTL